MHDAQFCSLHIVEGEGTRRSSTGGGRQEKCYWKETRVDGAGSTPTRFPPDVFVLPSAAPHISFLAVCTGGNERSATPRATAFGDGAGDAGMPDHLHGWD